jgi:hypothetical protein
MQHEGETELIGAMYTITYFILHVRCNGMQPLALLLRIYVSNSDLGSQNGCPDRVFYFFCVLF